MASSLALACYAAGNAAYDSTKLGGTLPLGLLSGGLLGQFQNIRLKILNQVPRGKNKNWLLVALMGAIILLVFGLKYSPNSFLSGSGTDQAGEKQREEVLVTRVIDGDTIEIAGGERVRYLGIDTPETVDPRGPVECFGREASMENKELVEGKYVRLEKDISETDKYGRLLRYVYVDDKLIDLELVKDGFAHILTIPPDIKYQDKFLAAEREAREAKRGLWGVCLDFESSDSSSACNVKGNISFTSGEKIYHLPSCDYYNETFINESKGERWFCGEKEALAAGWRKAKNCP